MYLLNDETGSCELYTAFVGRFVYGVRSATAAYRVRAYPDAPEGDGKPRTAPAAAPSLPRQTDTQLDRTQEATGGASSVRLRSLVTRTREAHSARTCVR